MFSTYVHVLNKICYIYSNKNEIAKVSAIKFKLVYYYSSFVVEIMQKGRHRASLGIYEQRQFYSLNISNKGYFEVLYIMTWQWHWFH